MRQGIFVVVSALCVVAVVALISSPGEDQSQPAVSMPVETAEGDIVKAATPLEREAVPSHEHSTLVDDSGRNADSFLRDHPNGEVIRAELVARGEDPLLLPAPPPLEDIWDQLVAQAVPDEARKAKYIADLVVFKEEWSLEVIARNLNLHLHGKPIDRDQLEEAAAPYNDEVRILAHDLADRRAEAIRSAIDTGNVLVTPYLVPESLWKKVAGDGVERPFSSGVTTYMGWNLSYGLTPSRYPAYREALTAYTRANARRVQALQEFVDGY